MLYEILNYIDKKLPFEEASAHCDIPCKIYDPMSAQLAVLTMIRMVDLLQELPEPSKMTAGQFATFNRLVGEKETHGQKLKDEIRVIWGDYFKQPQFDAFPNIHELTHEIMLKTSFAKQHIDKDATLALLAKVNEFARIFWESKGVATYVATCPYPPAREVVYPDLK